MCYTQDLIDDIASSFERVGYEDVSVADNEEMSAVKCYANGVKLYYVMAYKALGIYSFSEYGLDDDYVSKVFYEYHDLIKHLGTKGIIKPEIFGLSNFT